MSLSKFIIKTPKLKNLFNFAVLKTFKSNRDLKSHWDKTYDRAEIENLGWYEESPEPSASLIKKCNLKKNAVILNVGVGASTLIEELLSQGYENIIANDISSSAIQKLKTRMDKQQSDKVSWIIDDLTKPIDLMKLKKIDLWHDRAVLHFFSTESEQDKYFDLLKTIVKSGGFVIIAAFNLNGAKKCSGLPVFRYNKEMIQGKLGNTFELIESFDYTYTMPSEDTREYIYTLFKRIN